jgi:hypothetical protein
MLNLIELEKAYANKTSKEALIILELVRTMKVSLDNMRETESNMIKSIKQIKKELV